VKALFLLACSSVESRIYKAAQHNFDGVFVLHNPNLNELAGTIFTMLVKHLLHFTLHLFTFSLGHSLLSLLHHITSMHFKVI